MKKASVLVSGISFALACPFSSLAGHWVDGQWYHLGSDGVLVSNTTREIGGYSYTFDESGVYVTPNASHYITGFGSLNGRTLTNYFADYELTIPENWFILNRYSNKDISVSLNTNDSSYVNIYTRICNLPYIGFYSAGTVNGTQDA